MYQEKRKKETRIARKKERERERKEASSASKGTSNVLNVSFS